MSLLDLLYLVCHDNFQVPDTSNPERWANRIISNLLYYQSNYLLSAAIIFTLVAYIHPQDMFLGMLTVVSSKFRKEKCTKVSYYHV